MTLVLVRHTSAGDRAAWEGDDRLRPLDKKGRRQAKELRERLEGVPIRRIVSSPYLRCVQTVEPLAKALGLVVEKAPELGEERQWSDGPPLLAALLADDAVACVHGGVERSLGFDDRFRKGAVWLFDGRARKPADPVAATRRGASRTGAPPRPRAGRRPRAAAARRAAGSARAG